jgi:hypothetical protein
VQPGVRRVGAAAGRCAAVTGATVDERPTGSAAAPTCLIATRSAAFSRSLPVFCWCCDTCMAYGDDVCACTATYCPQCLLCESHCTCEPMPAAVVAAGVCFPCPTRLR